MCSTACSKASRCVGSIDEATQPNPLSRLHKILARPMLDPPSPVLYVPQVGLTAQAMGPTDTEGALLGLPPIHNHHVHVAPDYGVNWDTGESAKLRNCLLRGEDCWNGLTMTQLHGDYQCTDEMGGVECFGRTYGNGIKLFTAPLVMVFILNDVRPLNSPPMVWWFSTAHRLQIIDDSSSDRVPISVHAVSNGCEFHLPGKK